MLTVKRQGQNTHNDVDQRVRRRRTFVRVECYPNHGILAFGRLHRPKVKARGQIRVDADAHNGSSRQRRSRRLQFGLLGFYVADSFEKNHPVLRNEHHDGRNLEQRCESLGSDRDDRLGIIGRDDVTAVALQHGGLPSQQRRLGRPAVRGEGSAAHDQSDDKQQSDRPDVRRVVDGE